MFIFFLLPMAINITHKVLRLVLNKQKPKALLVSSDECHGRLHFCKQVKQVRFV